MRIGRPKAELVLSDDERAQLQSFARSRSLPAALGKIAPASCWPVPLANRHLLHRSQGNPGVHGQTVYIDPKAQMVIARYASHPLAGNAAIDPTSLPVYQALARHLIAQKR